jgi:4-aminobutyrate aminotransferase-like enzyme
VEAAMKLAGHNGKTEFIAAERSFHGYKGSLSSLTRDVRAPSGLW